jgi:hypothetical protein
MVSGELAGLGFVIATEAGPCVAGVILIQLIPFADAKSLPLLDDFERAVYAIWVVTIDGTFTPRSRSAWPVMPIAR